MAKTNEQFDRIFKDKLENHQEKPSALAWERLESQLPKKSNSGLGFWWAIAASVSILFFVGYLTWQGQEEVSEETLISENLKANEDLPLLDQNSSPEEVLQTPNTNDLISENESLVASSKIQEAQGTYQKASIPATPKTEYNPSEFTAPSSEILIAEVNVPELKAQDITLPLPEMKAPEINQALASSAMENAEEPLYRVSIYSNGIKKGEPVDKNLITELGKTVGQVEGLLGKVDNGFAELQDKKDNLFASLTSKRDRADEKP